MTLIEFELVVASAFKVAFWHQVDLNRSFMQIKYDTCPMILKLRSAPNLHLLLYWIYDFIFSNNRWELIHKCFHIERYKYIASFFFKMNQQQCFLFSSFIIAISLRKILIFLTLSLPLHFDALMHNGRIFLPFLAYFRLLIWSAKFIHVQISPLTSNVNVLYLIIV